MTQDLKLYLDKNDLKLFNYILEQFKKQIYEDKMMELGKRSSKNGQSFNMDYLRVQYINTVILHSTNIYMNYFPETKILKSEIHNKGLFADQDIEPNKIITLYPVHYIANSEGQIILSDILMTSKKQGQDNVRLRVHGPILRDYRIMINSNLLLDNGMFVIGGHPEIERYTTNGHFINHSKNHNAILYPVLESNTIFTNIWLVIAIKPIKKDSEIFINYGPEFIKKYDIKN